MGYYTNYQIEVKPFWIKDEFTKDDAKVICERICKLFYSDSNVDKITDDINYMYKNEDMHASDMIEEIINQDILWECCKWYEWQVNICELSKILPHLLFIISGEGEENGDLWKSYIHNEKWEHCQAKIVYPEPHYENL